MKAMKVLISADMEGISGVVDWSHITPGTAEYERFRTHMTADVNAAVEGAFDEGATEVIVTDGHWHGTNILLEQLDSRVRLNSGLQSPFDMLQGIDQGVSCVILVGYHGVAGSQHAILDHTWNYVRVREVMINSRVFGEIGLNAARAGHFGIPVVAITGDQFACREAQDFIGPNVATAVVKNSHGQCSAECLSLAHSQALIREAVRRGLMRVRIQSCPPPLKVVGPIHLEIEFMTSLGADRAIIMPGSERMSGTRLRYIAQDIIVAFNAFKSLVAMSRD